MWRAVWRKPASQKTSSSTSPPPPVPSPLIPSPPITAPSIPPHDTLLLVMSGRCQSISNDGRSACSCTSGLYALPPASHDSIALQPLLFSPCLECRHNLAMHDGAQQYFSQAPPSTALPKTPSATESIRQ